MVFMKLSVLKAFVAAVEGGSLRAGSRHSGVSQPAMSKMMRELERELATELLRRSTTGVAVTAPGAVLYEHACRAIRELSNATEKIEQFAGRMVGELSIGAVPIAVLLLIPEIMRTFCREFPDIRLCVREEMYIAQLTNLRMGEVDIAIGPIPDNLPPGEFHTESLMSVSMVVVAGKGNPLSRARSLSQLVDARWVYTSASGMASYAQILFKKHGLPPPEPAAIVNSTLGLASLLGLGDYVGLMPIQIATHPVAASCLAIVPIGEENLRLPLGVMARNDAMLKPAVKHFLRHLQRAAQHTAVL